MFVDARSVLERDGREDRRHRPGEHRPAARAVRVFPGGAARLALDLAARERVAAVVRAHALVLAAVPVVMIVLAHVPGWKSKFYVPYVRAESQGRPPRHRRDTCCAPDALVDFRTDTYS